MGQCYTSEFQVDHVPRLNKVAQTDFILNDSVDANAFIEPTNIIQFKQIKNIKLHRRIQSVPVIPKLIPKPPYGLISKEILYNQSIAPKRLIHSNVSSIKNQSEINNKIIQKLSFSINSCDDIYDDILGAFPDAMAIVNSNNLITYCNESLKYINEENLVNKQLDDVFPHFPINFNNVPKMMLPIEYKFNDMYLEITFAKLNTNSPKNSNIVRTYILCLKDITERRNLEQQLYYQYTQNEQILSSLFPKNILDRFRNGEKNIFDKHDNVTIGFCDIVQFTQLTDSNTEEIPNILNTLFAKFDEFVSDLGITKIETVGDCYIVASGIFDKHSPDNIIQFMLKSISFAKYELDIKLRAGINSGPISSGLIGNILPHYGIFGMSVIIAARLEATSMPEQIHISEHVIKLIDNTKYTIIDNGPTKLKGLAEPINTYFIQ
jgi:class 3 adenylate cyclase